MKLKTTNLFKFILILVLFTVGTVKSFAGEIDTTKVVFILDSKRISVTLLQKAKEKGNIQFITGANTTREALRNLGEKYRFGAYIYKTRKEVK